jgi:glucose/arabinose dehydrogenase
MLPQLNHGLALSPDSKTLYASTTDVAYSWPYDPSNSTISNPKTALVTSMQTSDHTTRTLLVPPLSASLLLISRGSTSNVDPAAADPTSGHSQIRAFSLSAVPAAGYNFTADGTRLGWGLRNSVGVAQHPTNGGVYSVENSVDQLERDGVDIHEDNPGEEMNFHGFLNGSAGSVQGSNYGYPECYAAWDVAAIPDNAGMVVGTQFAIGDANATLNDTLCAERTGPRLTFQAHMVG